MQNVVVERCWTTASYLKRCSWRQRWGRSQGQDDPPEGSLVVGAWTRCIFFEEFEKVYAPENGSFIKSEEEVQFLGVLPRETEDQLSKRALQGRAPLLSGLRFPF